MKSIYFQFGKQNKKCIVLFFSIFFTLTSHLALFGQGVGIRFCFDSLTNNCIPYLPNFSPKLASLSIDTASNPSNIWQIGVPQKPVLNSAFTSPNVIITDTVNSYPILDTSSFSIKFLRDTVRCDWQEFENLGFLFNFHVDSDSLTDFGKIEFSPNNGTSWVNLLEPPYAGLAMWEWTDDYVHYSPPVLSGSSGGWKEVNCPNFKYIAIQLGLSPCDTFTLRFSFISDGIQTNRDGLMFDNISIGFSQPIGLEEHQTKSNRTLLKILDLMGRETEDRPNVPLIYVYSDGTREKVFRVE